MLQEKLWTELEFHSQRGQVYDDAGRLRRIYENWHTLEKKDPINKLLFLCILTVWYEMQISQIALNQIKRKTVNRNVSRTI